MKYFLTEAERKASRGTCYFEFQNGKYQDKHWLIDAIYLQADKFDGLHLFDLFAKSIKDFDYYGTTEVNSEQWMKLVDNSFSNETWRNIIIELTPWVEECFKKHKCFTICGL